MRSRYMTIHMEIAKLEQEIDELRKKLQHAYESYGSFTDPHVLQLSTIIDKLIMKAQNLRFKIIKRHARTVAKLERIV